MKRYRGVAAACVYGSAVAILVCCILAVTCRPAAGLSVMEQCIGASCKVTSGGGSCGSGCAYWQGFDAQGRRVVRVMTAAHVLTTDLATCKFGRQGVTATGIVVKRDPGKDVGVVAIPWSAFPNEKWPPVVPLDSPQLVMPAYTVVFSVGCPNGCWPMKFWRGRTLGYESDKRLRVWPGIELGRSGSPVFRYRNGRATLVGILHSRNSSTLNDQTIAYAASLQVIHAARGTATRTAWPCAVTLRPCDVSLRAKPDQGREPGASPVAKRSSVTAHCPLPTAHCLLLTACGPDGCYPPGFDHWRINPYRYNQQKRDQYLYREIQKGKEQSQGTLPLPPIAPEVDLSPLTNRLDILIQGGQGSTTEMKTLAYEVQRLRGEVDALKATEARGRALVEKLSTEIPDVQRAVDAIRGDVQSVDEKAVDAAELAAGAATKATDAETKAVDAETKAIDAEATVTEAVDESNPTGLFARVRAHVADRVGSTVLGKVAEAKGWGFAGAGFGVAGIVLAGIALLVRRDFRDRRETGDPLLVEKLIGRLQPVAERTGTGIDDKALAAILSAVGKVADRRNPTRNEE